MSEAQLAELKPCYLLEQPEYPTLPKCENASVGPISREVQIAWLAGIIDGEGNLHFDTKVRTTTAGNRFSYFCPKVRITNTDVRMARRISEIYVQENIVFFYTMNKREWKNKKSSWKTQIEVSVSAQNSVRKILELVQPYLVNKQRLAELMIETTKFVQAQPHRGGKGQSPDNYCDRPEFIALLDAMWRERKWYLDPSTTARRARHILTW